MIFLMVIWICLRVFIACSYACNHSLVNLIYTVEVIIQYTFSRSRLMDEQPLNERLSGEGLYHQCSRIHFRPYLPLQSFILTIHFNDTRTIFLGMSFQGKIITGRKIFRVASMKISNMADCFPDDDGVPSVS